MEDWPKPPDGGSEGSDGSVSDIGDIPVDSRDQDPPYGEVEDPPAFHPDNQEELSDEEFRRLTERLLGTMTKAEWFKLCASEPYSFSNLLTSFLRLDCIISKRC